MALGSPQCAQLMFSGILPCDDTYPDLKKAGDTAFDGLKTIIEDGQSLGVFKKGDVEMLALSAWSAIHGLTLLLISGTLPEILSMDMDNRSLTTTVTATMKEGLKTS